MSEVTAFNLPDKIADDIDYVIRNSFHHIKTKAINEYKNFYFEISRVIPQLKEQALIKYSNKYWQQIEQLGEKYKYVYYAYMRSNYELYEYACRQVLRDNNFDENSAINVIVENMVPHLLVDSINEWKMRKNNKGGNNKKSKVLKDYLPQEQYTKIINWLLKNSGSRSDEFITIENDNPCWKHNRIELRAFHETIKPLLPTLRDQELQRMYEQTFTINLTNTDAFKNGIKTPAYHTYLDYFKSLPLK